MVGIDDQSRAHRAAQDLLKTTGADRLIPLVQIRMGFPAESFSLVVMPLLLALADHRRRSPSAPTGSQVDAGGQIMASLELALRALDIRRERILPPNVPPEVLGALAPRWTYAVLVASLFRSFRDSDTARELIETALPEDARSWMKEDRAAWIALTRSLDGPTLGTNPINDIVDAASGVGVEPRSPLSEVDNPGGREPSGCSEKEAEEGYARPVPGESSDTLAGMAGHFLDWLRTGIQEQRLNTNTQESLVHRVPEGLLLLSPGIFRSFLKNVQSESGVTGDPLKHLQREVFKLGWHLQGEGGLNLLVYEWRSGPRSGTKVHGVVIDQAERLLSPLPPMNADLVRPRLH